MVIDHFSLFISLPRDRGEPYKDFIFNETFYMVKKSIIYDSLLISISTSKRQCTKEFCLIKRTKSALLHTSGIYYYLVRLPKMSFKVKRIYVGIFLLVCHKSSSRISSKAWFSIRASSNEWFLPLRNLTRILSLSPNAFFTGFWK